MFMKIHLAVKKKHETLWKSFETSQTMKGPRPWAWGPTWANMGHAGVAGEGMSHSSISVQGEWRHVAQPMLGVEGDSRGWRMHCEPG